MMANGTSSKILRDIQLLTSMDAQEDPSQIGVLRSKLTALGFLLGTSLCPIFAAVYFFLGDAILGWSCIATGIVCLSLLLVPNTPKGGAFLREALTITGFLISQALTFRLGGASSPAALWMLLCPVMAVSAGGKASGIFWSIITLLAFVGFYIAEQSGFLFNPVISNTNLIFFLSNLALFVFIIAIMLIYEYLSVQLISKLNTAISKVNELAIRDELTGIYTRRELLRLLEIEVNRSKQTGTPLTLALIDIDSFKNINDTHGHGVGDHVLKALSTTFQNNKRQTDHFGRYGGEEFVLVMPGVDVEQAHLIMDRLHQKVRELSFASVSVPSITLSIGLCQLEARMESQDLIASADKAMYLAKTSGKNRIVRHGENWVMDFSAAELPKIQQWGNKRFEDLANSSPTIVWMTEPSGKTIFINQKWADFTGQTVEEGLKVGLREMIHPDDRDRVGLSFLQAKAKEQVFLERYRLKHKSGEYRWVLDTGSPSIGSNGAFLGYVGGVVDIQESVETEQALHGRNARFKAAIEAVEGIMWVCDAQGNIVDPQPHLEALTGQTFEEYKGYGWVEAIHPEDRENYLYHAYRSIATGEPMRVEHRLRTAQGEYRLYSVKASPVLSSEGSILEWVGVHTDVTEKRANEEQIVYLATHDTLTGLPNRSLLEARLQHQLSQREAAMHAVIILDINRFKIINDTLGHVVGDNLLMQVAAILKGNLRVGDTVARLSGDEFIVLLQNIKSEADATAAAKKLLDRLSQPLFIADNELTVNASIGVALHPRDGQEVHTLMRNADLAMYQAKEMGGNAIKFYDHTINVKMEQRFNLERDLRHAFNNRELFLDYQPKIDIAARRVYGVEALLRWRHPDQGLISPAAFIPLAEEIGLIAPIGEWVLQEAATQLSIWMKEGVSDLKVAVNLSVHQLHAPSFLPNLKALVNDGRINPSLIELEVTESGLMEKIASYQSILDEIKALGFTLAIDDFGTGYSSLSYLKRLPIETLKIDRSFIMDILKDKDDAAIVVATISMAQKMGLFTVAEGVETKEQALFLQDNGCAYMQGYYFSRPLAAGKVPEFISSFNSSK